MSEKTILVIDDSATIRRFVDNELSSAGYRVIMAGTAEDGIIKAGEENPDLIILDHQLPGTTGYEVCCQLLEQPNLATIPVVASSTLRKKAYAEYVDCDNVVDMLPKPYKPEALIATVANAIETAEMVVQSQHLGSAVPEVIDELGEADLAGTFQCFGIRELLDMLNNGEKSGMLEVQTDQCRIQVFVDRGRIQAVTGSGIDPDEIVRQIPESLSELVPVMKFTLSGRRGSEVDGIVDLLDTKVLDPRLLKKLLRLQAALLLRICFRDRLKNFRFDHARSAPSLYKKLPLECSLLALLVEGAVNCDDSEIPEIESGLGFIRRAIRGQNLDRAGLSGRHMTVMNALSETVSPTDLASQLGWELSEVLCVLHGFELAELVERKPMTSPMKVAVVSSKQALNQKLAAFFSSQSDLFKGKLVRDWTGAELLITRLNPQILLVDVNDESVFQHIDDLRQSNLLDGVLVAGMCESDSENTLTQMAIDTLDIVVGHDFSNEDLQDAFLHAQSDSDYSVSAQQVEA